MPIHLRSIFLGLIGLLTGFALLVCVPVGALVLIFTLIGIPLALATVAMYLALLPIAYVGTAIGLGDWTLQKWRPARPGELRWRIGATALALLLLALLAWVPWLGGFVVFAALVTGLGAMLLQVWRRLPAARAAAGSPGTAP